MSEWTVKAYTGNTYKLTAGDKTRLGEKEFLEEVAAEHNALAKVKEHLAIMGERPHSPKCIITNVGCECGKKNAQLLLNELIFKLRGQK